jgi:hypothetical protein
LIEELKSGRWEKKRPGRSSFVRKVFF